MSVAITGCPGETRAGALRTAEFLGDFEPGHDSERERQPGLIILKYPTEDSDFRQGRGEFCFRKFLLSSHLFVLGSETQPKVLMASNSELRFLMRITYRAF